MAQGRTYGQGEAMTTGMLIRRLSRPGREFFLSARVFGVLPNALHAFSLVFVEAACRRHMAKVLLVTVVCVTQERRPYVCCGT